MKMNKKNNVIPRNFKLIKGKMLIDTYGNKAGDIVHVSRNEFGSLTMLNTRTEQRFCPFISMIRNSEVYEIIDILFEKESDTK